MPSRSPGTSPTAHRRSKRSSRSRSRTRERKKKKKRKKSSKHHSRCRSASEEKLSPGEQKQKQENTFTDTAQLVSSNYQDSSDESRHKSKKHKHKKHKSKSKKAHVKSPKARKRTSEKSDDEPSPSKSSPRKRKDESVYSDVDTHKSHKTAHDERDQETEKDSGQGAAPTSDTGKKSGEGQNGDDRVNNSSSEASQHESQVALKSAVSFFDPFAEQDNTAFPPPPPPLSPPRPPPPPHSPPPRPAIHPPLSPLSLPSAPAIDKDFPFEHINTHKNDVDKSEKLEVMISHEVTAEKFRRVTESASASVLEPHFDESHFVAPSTTTTPATAITTAPTTTTTAAPMTTTPSTSTTTTIIPAISSTSFTAATTAPSTLASSTPIAAPPTTPSATIAITTAAPTIAPTGASPKCGSASPTSDFATGALELAPSHDSLIASSILSLSLSMSEAPPSFAPPNSEHSSSMSTDDTPRMSESSFLSTSLEAPLINSLAPSSHSTTLDSTPKTLARLTSPDVTSQLSIDPQFLPTPAVLDNVAEHSTSSKSSVDPVAPNNSADQSGSSRSTFDQIVSNKEVVGHAASNSFTKSAIDHAVSEKHVAEPWSKRSPERKELSRDARGSKDSVSRDEDRSRRTVTNTGDSTFVRSSRLSLRSSEPDEPSRRLSRQSSSQKDQSRQSRQEELSPEEQLRRQRSQSVEQPRSSENTPWQKNSHSQVDLPFQSYGQMLAVPSLSYDATEQDLYQRQYLQLALQQFQLQQLQLQQQLLQQQRQTPQRDFEKMRSSDQPVKPPPPDDPPPVVPSSPSPFMRQPIAALLAPSVSISNLLGGSGLDQAIGKSLSTPSLNNLRPLISTPVFTPSSATDSFDVLGRSKQPKPVVPPPVVDSNSSSDRLVPRSSPQSTPQPLSSVRSSPPSVRSSLTPIQSSPPPSVTPSPPPSVRSSPPPSVRSSPPPSVRSSPPPSVRSSPPPSVRSSPPTGSPPSTTFQKSPSPPRPLLVPTVKSATKTPVPSPSLTTKLPTTSTAPSGILTSSKLPVTTVPATPPYSSATLMSLAPVKSDLVRDDVHQVLKSILATARPAKPVATPSSSSTSIKPSPLPVVVSKKVPSNKKDLKHQLTMSPIKPPKLRKSETQEILKKELTPLSQNEKEAAKKLVDTDAIFKAIGVFGKVALKKFDCKQRCSMADYKKIYKATCHQLVLDFKVLYHQDPRQVKTIDLFLTPAKKDAVFALVNKEVLKHSQNT